MRLSRSFTASALLVIAVLFFVAGFVTGCASSDTPTAQPVPVTAPKPAATPQTLDAAKAPVATPASDVAKDKAIPPVTADPSGKGLLVKDVPVPTGVAVDAEKTAIDPKTGLASGAVTVHPFDPKKPLKCTPAVVDHCKENADGSIAVSLDPKKPGS